MIFGVSSFRNVVFKQREICRLSSLLRKRDWEQFFKTNRRDADGVKISFRVEWSTVK